jgi:hypothetical protein
MVATVLEAKQVLMKTGCSTTVQTTQRVSIGSGMAPSKEFMPTAREGNPRSTRFIIVMMNDWVEI